MALPNAFFFGLTGTPINKLDKNTFATFGALEDRTGYMSRYSFADSVADKATLPLHFEPVPVKLHVDQAAIDEVAFSGRVVCIGYSKNDVTFHTGLFVKKEINIHGSRNAMPADFEAVIRYLQRGTCPKDELISAIVKPENALHAMQKWVEAPSRVFRILVDFT